MHRRSKVLAFSGCLILALTLILGFLNITDWSGVSVPAFVFLLWSELALFGGLLLVEVLAKQTFQVFFRAGCTVTLVFYAAAAFAAALVFLFFFPLALVPLFTIELILLGLAAILCAVFAAVGKGLQEKSQK